MTACANVSFFGKLFHWDSDGEPETRIPELVKMYNAVRKFVEVNKLEPYQAVLLVIEENLSELGSYGMFRGYTGGADYFYVATEKGISFKKWNREIGTLLWEEAFNKRDARHQDER